MGGLAICNPLSAATGLALLVALLGGSASAAAASGEIGAVAEIRAGQAPSPITNGGFAVQVGEAGGSYAVPAGYSAITAWHHSTGTVSGALTFKVYRPTGGLREFSVVASDTRSVTAGTVHTFPVQIPVQPGDRIGLSSDDVELAYETLAMSDRIGFFSSDLAPGAIGATDGVPFPEYRLDISATIASAPASTSPPTGPPSVLPAAPPPAPASYPVPPPSLERLRIYPRAFAAARRGGSARANRRRRSGARVSFRIDLAATVRFKVQRIAAGRRRGRGKARRCVMPTRRNRNATRCPRYVPLKGSFSRRARAGVNSFYFTGRVGGRRLSRGTYRLMATPRAGGVWGRSQTRTFKISR